MPSDPIRFLFLGDSYTVGESIPVQSSWPKRILKTCQQETTRSIGSLTVAKTGWTSGELLEAFKQSGAVGLYDLATIMVGVNNQYRGLSPDAFQLEFRQLLLTALPLVEKPKSLVLISIPDWSVTPFASDRDQSQISREIDEFNQRIEKIASEFQLDLINVTEISRQAACDPNLIAEDKLHPSAIMHRKWAEVIWPVMARHLNKG